MFHKERLDEEGSDEETVGGESVVEIHYRRGWMMKNPIKVLCTKMHVSIIIYNLPSAVEESCGNGQVSIYKYKYMSYSYTD